MNSYSQLENIISDLQSNGKTVTVKKLKTRGPRKGETLSRNASLNKGGAIGSVDSKDSTGSVTSAVGGGKGQTITKVTGLGSKMVSNLSKVQKNYQSTIQADRKAAAQERMEEKLDQLLATI